MDYAIALKLFSSRPYTVRINLVEQEVALAQPIGDTASTRALQQLEESRLFLQQLVRVAGLIEGLKQSLEDMLAQGAVNTDEQPYIARLIEGLGRKVRNRSDAEVKLSLEKLDQRLRTQFRKLAPLIDEIPEDGGALEGDLLTTAAADIEALKRLAQTALALRGLLMRRGLVVPEFRLPLDRHRLQQRLRNVACQEQFVRQAVIKQVRQLGVEIRHLLNQENLSDAIRALLEQMQEGLRANLEHLKAGHGVAALPLAMEEVSFLEPPGEAPPLPSNESRSLAPGAAAAQPERSTPTPAENGTLDEAGQPPGWWLSLRLWVSSPWNVTWRDIRTGRYKG